MSFVIAAPEVIAAAATAAPA
ncbi:hypothetical protein, partial [Mycobacterium tuberculosis]